MDCDVMEPKRENNTLTFKAMVETSADEHHLTFSPIFLFSFKFSKNSNLSA